jgi:hypothetical protein
MRAHSKEHADGSDFNNDDWRGPTSEIVNKVYPDVRVRNEGTIVLFTPIMPRAKQWIAGNVQPDAQWLGDALVVEHRYAVDIATAMREAGLVLA